MGGNVYGTDAKKDPPIFAWQGHRFQKTGLPRLYRSEMPALEREALETEANTHKQTILTLLRTNPSLVGACVAQVRSHPVKISKADFVP